MKHIKFCSNCKIYSMQDKCPKCSKETVLAKPPKFSLNDKYASYRRESKKKELEEKGLL